ncbi:MAG: tetratricopeptide repeat protein [Granulosicoccaceae bacterium]
MINLANSKIHTSKGVRCSALLAVMLLATACATTAPQSPQMAKPAPYSDDVFEISALADKAYRASRWIEAAQYYNKLSELVPQDAYVWFRLGNTYAQQGAYQQAIGAYETSISRNAEQPKPWFNLSTAYLLKAQAAMQMSWSQMRADDPAKKLVATKLQMLNALMHSRIEDSIQETNYP